MTTHRTKKLMSESPRLVDFILHLPDGQVKVLGEFFQEINLIHCTCEYFFFWQVNRTEFLCTLPHIIKVSSTDLKVRSTLGFVLF